MESRKLIFFITLLLSLTACNNDLDEAGFFNSEYDANTRFTMSMDWNSTHPYRVIPVSDSTYTILFCGDTHIGTSRKFSMVLDSAKYPQAAALVVAGDITRGHPENYDTLNNLMQRADSVIWFFTAGNHDLYFGSWPLYYEYFGASAYYFTVLTPTGSDLYIILDSGNGTLGDTQLSWLSTTLGNIRSQYRHCVVATHLNIFKNGMGMSTNMPVEELYALLDIFAENEVDYVISGHDHDRDEAFLGPTHYITMDALRDDEAGSSYLQLNVSNDSITHTFNDVE